MKKLLIISALDIWSMGKNKGAPSLWYTLKGYADNNWKVYFITGNKDKNSVYDIHKNISIIRFDAKWIKKLFRIKKISFIAKFIWWIYFQIYSFIIGYKICKKENINIFYGYEIFGVPVAKILAEKFNKPIISRFQGTILMEWVGKKFWKIRFWQHILAFKIPVNLLIMTNDGTQGDKVLRKLNVNTSKVKFWMNGVDKDVYISSFDKDKFKGKLSINKNKKILLMISRLVNWKRLDRAINAMPEIIKKYENVELLIIGDGSERKNLENSVKKLKIEKYVKFLGVLPRQDLKKYYNLADIFISMYDIANVGNPVLEAMSCGRCIITLDGMDTNKLIHHNKNGVLLKLVQLKNLPNIIVNLLKDDKKREELGKNAKKFAGKNLWTWNERINSEIKEVENLLKNKELKK